MNLNDLVKNSLTIHIVGIGGVGMSGIAKILHKKGLKVQGSDLSQNYYIDSLKDLGITVFHDHKEDNLKNCDLIVKSSAIKDDNPELKYANLHDIPVVKRSTMLTAIVADHKAITVTGTHGKTSVTALIFTILSKAGIDPSVLNGGWINSISSNAYLGGSNYFCTEADESDGTFLELNSNIGIITNIESEHMDFYGTIANLESAYEKYALTAMSNDLCIYCYDCIKSRKLLSKYSNKETLINYGFEEGSDLRAVNLKSTKNGVSFDILISNHKFHTLPRKIEDIRINSFGRHNILNSIAAIIVALHLKISLSDIREGLLSYEGVKRRFSQIASINNIMFIDDYAHHPTEVQATLNTAKQLVKSTGGKIIAILQPHRYSRLKSLWHEFICSLKDADISIITDVYSAGEAPLNNIDGKNLANQIEKYKKNDSHSQVFYCSDLKKELLSLLYKIVRSGDYVVFMGAGDITSCAKYITEHFQCT